MTVPTGSTSEAFPGSSSGSTGRSRTRGGGALWRAPRPHDAVRMVSRARERNGRVRAADDRRHPGTDALWAVEAALLAALRGRGRPSVCRPAHGLFRVAPSARALRRLLPALLADAAGRARSVDLSAARDRPRRARGRAARRSRNRQPLPEAALVPLLATVALSELRGLGARPRPRARRRNRPRRCVGGRPLRLFGRSRRGLPGASRGRVAALGRNPIYLTRRVRT